MKIAGRRLEGRNTAVVEIRRPDGDLHLTVQALPLGFESRLASHGVRRPAVPRRVARDSRGRILRDEAGQAVEALQGWKLAAVSGSVAIFSKAGTLAVAKMAAN